MANFPGPYELRINYTCDINVVRQHQLRLSMDMTSVGDPGDLFINFQTETKDAVNPTLELITNDLVDLLKVCYTSSGTFVDAELWHYPNPSHDANFVTSKQLGVAGTAGGPILADAQAIMTFRSENGGIGKLDLRESIFVPGERQPFLNAPTPAKNLMVLVASVATPYIARDNGYLFSPLYFLPGTNERSWKETFGR